MLTVAAVDVDVPFVREEYRSGADQRAGRCAHRRLLKPDIAAFADVSAASYGPRGFNGTSAATPASPAQRRSCAAPFVRLTGRGTGLSEPGQSRSGYAGR